MNSLNKFHSSPAPLARTRVACICSAICFWLLSPLATAQPAKYDDVIRATGKVVDLLMSTTAPNQETLITATTQACKALETLLRNPDFSADLNKISAQHSDHGGKLGLIKGNVGRFTEEFLMIERQRLKDAGLSPRSIGQLTFAAECLKDTLDRKADPKAIVAAMDKVRAELCDADAELRSAKSNDERNVRIMRMGLKTGGVVVILVDLATFGASATVSVGSVAIGTGMMGWTEF